MNRILILLASLLVGHDTFGYDPPPYPDKWPEPQCFKDTKTRHKCYGPAAISRTGPGYYFGGWMNEKEHGLAVFTFTDGYEFVGLYRFGKRYEGIQYDPLGKADSTFSKGRFCYRCSPTSEQLAIVRLARCKLYNRCDAKPPAPKLIPDSDQPLVSTGTGFVVNPDFVVTADHVLRKNDQAEQCGAVSIVYRKEVYEAKIVDGDPANDLGLLKLSEPIPSTAKIRNDPDLRLGETAVNYGFPLFGELSSNAKVTSGAVNSLAGYNNNSAFIQYDAASQFGNSGGPVLDASGNVIGVVSAKLDDAKNQLVNFATKSTILEGFLKANKVPFEKADLGEKLELPDIAEKAETFTVLVGCWE